MHCGDTGCRTNVEWSLQTGTGSVEKEYQRRPKGPEQVSYIEVK